MFKTSKFVNDFLSWPMQMIEATYTSYALNIFESRSRYIAVDSLVVPNFYQRVIYSKSVTD